MEFVTANSQPDAPVEFVRVNWYYRPRDIQRKVTDTRVVYASMHSDMCPLTSLRGKCTISHISDIPNLDEFRTHKDSFWFDKLYDRYIHRYYEIISTQKIINVPQHVKKVLDERWRYILVEIGRGKELTSAVKTCKRCVGYAANHDSVDCAVCKNTYHMACVRPPLTKKPARGFAWACAACSRAQERKLEARHTPNLNESASGADEEMLDEEEEAGAAGDTTSRSSPVPNDFSLLQQKLDNAPPNLWPYRYLGVHCRVEDALDFDDRIYPRASSRLGPRHQANVNVWHGRPVELVKPAEIRKKYVKTNSHKKDAKLSKETLALIEAEREEKMKRPKWVMDEPLGYVARGEDALVDIRGKKERTAQVIFRLPEVNKISNRGGDEHELAIGDVDRERRIDEYMERVKPLAEKYNLEPCSTNFLTKAVEKFCEMNYNADKAVEAMSHLHLRSDLKEPDLNREEIKRFEEGVAKYGSELHNVARHVGPNVKEARVVRFYYSWKKTERGRQIWGNYSGRKSKKESRLLEEVKSKDAAVSKLLDDVADDFDDSAFDSAKAAEKKRGFECKFCATRSSRQWRRAPFTAPGTLVPGDALSKNSKDKSSWLTVALCGKCAYLWRRYGIQFESIEEVSKKIAAAGGRASKRRIDEELMRTIVEAQQESGDTISTTTAAAVASVGVEVPAAIVETQEPLKKKPKPEKEINGVVPEIPAEKKRIVLEKPPEPQPLKPEPPRVKVLPCFICYMVDLPGDELTVCRDCRMTVHKSCYGVSPHRNSRKWYCDTCSNDRNTQVSATYECVLCPIKYTHHELMEPPKVSHKKKTDREREKERKEKELVEEALKLYKQTQEQHGRPSNPREPLKRTAWNNWAHVACAVWTPEIKFGAAELLDEAEGVGFIPPERFQIPCKICRVSADKPTIKCHFSNCDAHFHVGCAHRAGHFFGFDVTPVKGSRRDSVNTIKLGEENGTAVAAIWCYTHTIATVWHSMLEATEAGITAMQLYARTFKQVDKSTTGTVRRAAQFQQLSQAVPAPTSTNRRASAVNGMSTSAALPTSRSVRTSPIGMNNEDDPVVADAVKKCFNCAVEVSPRWFQVERRIREVVNPSNADGITSRASGQTGVTEVAANSGTLNGHQTQNSTVEHERLDLSPPLSRTAAKSDSLPLTFLADQRAKEKVETFYQCQKCHVEKKPLPPLSPELPKQFATVQTEIEPTPTRPLFYQPQPSQPSQPSQPPPQRPPFLGPHLSLSNGNIPPAWNRTPSASAPDRSPQWHRDSQPYRPIGPPHQSSSFGGPKLYHPVPPQLPPQVNGFGPPHIPSQHHVVPPAPQPPYPHPPPPRQSPHFSPRVYAQPPPPPPGSRHYPPNSPQLDGRGPGVATSPPSNTTISRSYGPPPPTYALERPHEGVVDQLSRRPATPPSEIRPATAGASTSPNVRNLLL